MQTDTDKYLLFYPIFAPLSRRKREIYKIGFDKMSKAIERYRKEREGKDDQYTMYGSTFFNSGYKEYLEDAEESNDNGFRLMIWQKTIFAE